MVLYNHEDEIHLFLNPTALVCLSWIPLGYGLDFGFSSQAISLFKLICYIFYASPFKGLYLLVFVDAAYKFGNTSNLFIVVVLLIFCVIHSYLQSYKMYKIRMEVN